MLPPLPLTDGLESKPRLMSSRSEELVEEEWVESIGGVEMMDARCDEKTSEFTWCIG